MRDKWSKETPIETSGYYWQEEPIFIQRSNPHTSEPAVAELFSGLGGLSLGFQQAGYSISLGADIHRPSFDSFKVNHPASNALLGDLQKVSANQMKTYLEGTNTEILLAGVPCQGFSLANRKRHDNDQRNHLFRDFLRLAKPVHPRAIVIENVSGMRSASGGSFVRDISKAVEYELGLDVHILFLNSAHYGVPQNRERLFFVGLPKGTKWRPPLPTHGKDTGNRVRTVRDAISDLPELRSGESAMLYTKEPETELQAMLRGDEKELTCHRAPNHPDETLARISKTNPGEPMYENYRQRIRLAWDMPSPTQVSGGIRAQFQFGHPSQVRGLTIRERARIQTFPDSILVKGGLVQGRVQTGNAVPPLLARAIAEAIRNSLD